MKTICKKIYNLLEGTNGIIFIIYALFITLTQVYIHTVDDGAFWIGALIWLVICLLGCPFILRLVRNASFNEDKNCKFTIHNNVWRVVFFIVPLLVFLFHYFLYYPGCFSNDSLTQYEQCMQGVYNDWHPVFHTLFAFKLPLFITRGWIGSIVLFQMILFSAVIGYSLCAIKQYTNTGYALLTMLFILINPETSSMALFPWKDVSFAIGAMLMVTYGLKVYFTKGDWLKRPLNVICFVLTAVATTLFRHNALLFTVPLVFAVLLFASKKRALVIATACILLIGAVKMPLYAVLKVESPDSRQIETLGLPMTVIGAAVTVDAENVDEDILEFAYKVAPKEVWQSTYYYGSYNEVKWDQRTNNDVIEEYGAAKVLNMAARCFKDCPKASFTGLIKLTEVVYTVSDDYHLYITPYSSLSQYSEVSESKAELQRFDKQLSADFNKLFPHLFMYVGMMHIILLVSVLAKCKLNKWADWKKIFFVLPVFLYNFGTTLLLTGSGDSCRFFFYTFMLTPILLVFLYKNQKDGSSQQI
ncbi:MAG: hypothetical protein IJF58_05050 [Clostridia bacterium]|nr:hypothetical protein [Clostridia bacterium]